MTGLTTITVPFLFILSYLLFTPVGLLVIKKIAPSLAVYGHFALIPVYFGIGLSINTIGFFVSAVFWWSPLVPLAFLVLPLLYLILSSLRTEPRKTLNQLIQNIRHHKLPFVLFLGTMLYFMLAVSGYRWPPPGDLLRHGAVTSLILFQEGFPSDLSWLGNISSLFYPLGFHITSANISLLTGLYPAESVFLLGAIVISLIPNSIFLLTYALTSHRPLSTLSYLGTLIIPTSLRAWPSGIPLLESLTNLLLPFSANDMERWITGYFHNGPYPNIYAFLLVFLFCILLTQTLSFHVNSRFLLITSIIIAALIITYLPFAVYLILYLMVAVPLSIGASLQQRPLENRPQSRIWILLAIGISIAILVFLPTILTVAQDIFTYLAVNGRRQFNPYTIPWHFLVTSISGFLVMISTPLALYSIMGKTKYSNLSVFFLITLIPLILSIHPAYFPFLGFLLPDRGLMIHTNLAWVFVGGLILSFSNSKQARTIVNNTWNRVSHIFQKPAMISRPRLSPSQAPEIPDLTPYLVLFLLFAPILWGQFALVPARLYAPSETDAFPHNYAAATWISQSIPRHDLILNDLSWDSLYLQSYTMKNVTYTSFIVEFDADRGRDLRQIWRNPSNEPLLRAQLKQYNVSYIYSSMAKNELRLTHLGEDGNYESKSFSPEEYRQILSTYPFLVISFQQENALVYWVNQTQL